MRWQHALANNLNLRLLALPLLRRYASILVGSVHSSHSDLSGHSCLLIHRRTTQFSRAVELVCTTSYQIGITKLYVKRLLRQTFFRGVDKIRLFRYYIEPSNSGMEAS